MECPPLFDDEVAKESRTEDDIPPTTRRSLECSLFGGAVEHSRAPSLAPVPEDRPAEAMRHECHLFGESRREISPEAEGPPAAPPLGAMGGIESSSVTCSLFPGAAAAGATSREPQMPEQLPAVGVALPPIGCFDVDTRP